MLFAVGTHDSVFIFDTQQSVPIVQLSHLHYHHITDLAWLENDIGLMITSSDGFCSVACFDDGELGERYVAPLPQTVSVDIVVDETTTDSNGDVKQELGAVNTVR
jgi:chromatin assembly factor 1 subunit B